MSDLLSIDDARQAHITKLRLPVWANPRDHIEIHITADGLLGPWVKFYSDMNQSCGLKNPHAIFISEFDVTSKEWSPYSKELN